ncbi:Isocitrate lyase [Exaiptasia diaphana]|nr:Isocitrate lyase [Exaiptasia diaphana]
MASNYTYEKRWAGIKRNYGPEEVERLRGTVKIEYSLAKRGADRLWEYITRGGDSYINALGALTGSTTRLFLRGIFQYWGDKMGAIVIVTYKDS